MNYELDIAGGKIREGKNSARISEIRVKAP
jgi:hypothetical protein